MKSLFNPISIAIIGASADPKKVGNIIIRNILKSDYNGAIYPINPREAEIAGLPAFKSIMELKGRVELVILAIPARFVADALNNAGDALVKSAIIISAGFREEGVEGLHLEKQLDAIRLRYGMRVVGPNCFGLMNTYANLNATFSSLYPAKGNISLSSQSGAVGTSILDWSNMMGRGLSKFASLGNKMDVDEADMIEYLREDSTTEVVALYVESIKDGRSFIDAAKKFTECKPLVVLKSGRTGQGAKAASSHTGALAGADAVYDAAFKKVNALRVTDIDQMFDAVNVFSTMPLIKGDGVAILTNAGGLGVMAADACGDHELTLSELSSETVHRLESEIPSMASTNNPVDVRGDARSIDFSSALRILAEDSKVNGLIVMVSPVDTVDMDEVASIIGTFSQQNNLPIVASFVGGEACKSPVSILRKNRVPDYPTPDRAVRALAMMLEYQEGRNNENGPMIMPTVDGKIAVTKLLDSVQNEGRCSLTEGEGKAILSAYGISVPTESDARCASEAVKIAQDIGYPVVMKVISPDIHHKTDVGGVVVNVQNDESVITTYALILERCLRAMPEARIDGVSIQKQVKGAEVITSIIRDDQFGPVLSFGAGGIFVEMMKEISQGIAPMGERELDELLRSTRVYQLLTGLRGRPASDIESLKDLMRRLISISLDHPRILELEINPVMVEEKGRGCWAVDALITIGGKS